MEGSNLSIRLVSFFALSLLLCACAHAANVKITVEDSGSKEADLLVVRLVSQRPAPFPTGYSSIEADLLFTMPYMTLEVSNAIARLKGMGPKTFPALVKHLKDDRYSFSDVSAAWVNHSVGDAVIEVLSDGHYGYSGYKSRHTPSGGAVYLSFEDYLKAKKPEKWAEWAKTRTQGDIQIDFIDWCIMKEKERGFTDKDQEKKVMENYQRGREKVRLQYYNKGNTTNGSSSAQPDKKETPPLSSLSR